MTGIAALFAPAEGGHRRAHAALLAATLDRLRHHGPDNACQMTELGGVAGHNSTGSATEVDRSSPVASAGGLWIAADARIDNRQDLAHALGFEAPPSCDAALILEAYRRWGTACARRLTGDFAFVILDTPGRVLFCARDQLGLRPLYYCDHGGLVRCASEMNALLADPELPRRPNLDQVAFFAVGEYNEAGDTLYEGISAVPPAHQLTVSTRGVRVERYWAPDPWYRLEGLSDAEYAERLRLVATEAIRCHLPTTGQVGVYLSGGIDSACVAGETERLRRAGHGPATPPLMFHATFPGWPEDETRYSDAVADKWGLPRINAAPLGHEDLMRPQAIAGHPDIFVEPRLAMCRLFLDHAAHKIDRNCESYPLGA